MWSVVNRWCSPRPAVADNLEFGGMWSREMLLTRSYCYIDIHGSFSNFLLVLLVRVSAVFWQTVMDM